AAFFVTRDDRLLAAGEVLFANHQIRVLRPSELISKFDEEARPQLYAPARRDGSSLVIRRVRSEDVSLVTKTFQNFPRGETKAFLRRHVRDALADSHRQDL